VGRQIAVMMDRDDERHFLEFLSASAPIRLFESFAPTQAALEADDFADELSRHNQYYVWNQRFSWEPRYGAVGPSAVDPSMVGWAYLRNASAAPLLEVSRSNVDRGVAGRLYWGRDFSAPHGLEYDA
jgi:hypothetical protein